jgi:hypothetical protein
MQQSVAHLAVARNDDGDQELHLAYPTARRTLCLDVAGFVLRGRAGAHQATCERCSRALEAIDRRLKQDRLAPREQLHAGHRGAGYRVATG